MRKLFSLALAVMTLCTCSLVANGQEHSLLYTAIVNDDDATVHSGPGKSHYATHRLKQDDLVDVYRHDPGGWCLIKPPEQSFSLIPLSAVKLLSKDVGEITVDSIDAWVGTKLGPVENPMSQKTLRKGERVAIVGKVSWPNPGGKPNVWLQIEPPSGEFRWIHKSHLQLPPAKDTATSVDYSEPPSLNEPPSKFKSKTAPNPITPLKTKKSDTRKELSSLTSLESSGSAGSGWKAATRPIPEEETEEPIYSANFTSPISSRIPEGGFAEQATLIQDQEPSDPRFESWDGRAIERTFDKPDRFMPPQDRFASLDSMDRQRSYIRDRQEPLKQAAAPLTPTSANSRQASSVMQIEEKLSDEILKDPRSWQLADLKFETERVRARSNDPVERLALQHVLDKITKCDAICKGYQQASSAGPRFNSPQTQMPAGISSSIYDARGWLKRLASSTGSIDPVYVLQDSLGNVTHEIAGTAGMNLGQYVDKQVGVMGRRGFNRRLNLNHVTAERVIVVR